LYNSTVALLDAAEERRHPRHPLGQRGLLGDPGDAQPALGAGTEGGAGDGDDAVLVQEALRAAIESAARCGGRRMKA
jgi:hypothetical protein